MTDAEADLSTATGAREEATWKLTEAKAGEGRLQAIQADLTRLEEVEKKVRLAAELQAAFDAAAKDEATAKRHTPIPKRHAKGSSSRRDSTDLGSNRRARLRRREFKLTGELAALNQELVKARAHAKAQGAVAEAEGKVEAAEKELAKETRAEEAAEAALTEAEARLSRTQAIILAEKLTEGAPCPVCGVPRSSVAGPWHA